MEQHSRGVDGVDDQWGVGRCHHLIEDRDDPEHTEARWLENTQVHKENTKEVSSN